jgi:hypothetical protein
MEAMNGRDLVLFSQAHPLFYKLSKQEELWRKLYLKTVPRSYLALQHPHPAWKFDDAGARMFLYYATIELQKQEISTEAALVSHVMKTYPDNVLLQTATCCITMRLAWSPRLIPSDIDQNRVLFRQQGALPHLIQLLQNFNDSRLLSCVLGALTNLANNQANTDVLVRLNGVSIILNAMDRVKQIPVIDYGCSALANICRKNNLDPAAANEIKEKGLSLALYLLREATSNNFDVKINEAPLDLINVLVAKDFNLKDSLGKTMLDVVKKILLQQNADTGVLSYACESLQCFCKECCENKIYSKEIGLSELLFSILEKHHDADLLDKALFAMYHIYWKQEIPHDFFKRLMQVTVKMMEEHPTNGDFLIGATAILADFGFKNATNLQYMKTFKLGPKVKEIVSTFAKSPDELAEMVAIFY